MSFRRITIAIQDRPYEEIRQWNRVVDYSNLVGEGLTGRRFDRTNTETSNGQVVSFRCRFAARRI
ncbi:hypothetical protein Pd630_LPD00155 [Rhodococcus opacus PD630]|nr:hypothetical protein Pd630_LPD00155 [Rhodococcus opacus PD630]